MSIRTFDTDGIYILIGDYCDIGRTTISDSQLVDINSLSADKKRRERELTYTLINRAAGIYTRRFGFLAGATLGHHANGAPFLNTDRKINISISHCRSGACIALSDVSQNFGIDIEDSSDKLARVKSKFISECEEKIIDSDMLLWAWTIKEAVYKAAGTPGLSLRDGITIEPVMQSRPEIAAGFSLMASAMADGNIYRCLSLSEPNRCITISVM